ncbi:T9SS type A sorting domain-containing protein [bacterium]|nr:T9SS type A sorting domain-containing protein [bacterium]
MFSGFSVPGTNDTIAIYYKVRKTQALATKTLLFDFRGTEYLADNTYRNQTDINLAPYTGLNYFAIKYVNSNASSNWLSVHFDDITISENSASLNDQQTELNSIVAYPNPTNNELFINNDRNQIQSLHVCDDHGQIHTSLPNIKTELIELDLSKLNTGVYTVQVQTINGVLSKRIIVE